MSADSNSVLIKKKAKASLVEGAAYQGYLTQFKQSYELRYDIGKALSKVPKEVSSARKELGWKDHKVEFVCEGKCTIAQLGIDEAVVLAFDSMGGTAARLLIMSPDKPELGLTVAHLDVRREDLTAGDESWWLGQEPAIRATRVVSTGEMRMQVAAQRLGLVAGARYSGKCVHPFFRPFDVTYEFGKFLPAVPDEAARARTALGWSGETEACCKGFQSIPEFGAHASEVVFLADSFNDCRRILVVPTEKPELGVSVAVLSEDCQTLTGGERGWWTEQEPQFVAERVR